MKKNHPPARLSRRDVVAAGPLAAAAGVPFICSALPAGICPEAEEALLAVFKDSSGPSQIGSAVLDLAPDMRDRAQLLGELLRDLRIDTESVLQLERTEIANRLAQRVRDDFAARNTVMLDGWLVSLTELRLCALAALTKGSVTG
jgi:hypothetical protein